MLHVRLSLLFLPLIFWGQTLRYPNGTFLSDTVRIGDPTQYALSFHHSKDLEIFFPDSNSKFYPFEFISKEFFTTETNDSISIDSVVYTLRTFEIQQKVELGLPIQLVSDDDTSRIYAIPDSINIQQYIREGMDSLTLKTSTALVPMNTNFNYPYFIVISVGGILAAWLLYRLFGASFLRNYKLYNMYQNHIQFIREFEILKEACSQDPSIAKIEKALVVWKEYLSKLEDEPIYTYTTTEIITLYNQEDLKESLQEIDRYIYKGEIASNTEDVLDSLGKFSTKEYKRIREVLQRGR
jgi:hypothetical protein